MMEINTVIDFLIAAAVSTLSGMGVGGGGLLVLYLTAIKKMPQLSAQSVNMIFFICSASASVIYKASKNKINFKALAVLIPIGILGAFAGVSAASVTDPAVLRKIFGWFLILSGASVFIKKK